MESVCEHGNQPADSLKYWLIIEHKRFEVFWAATKKNAVFWDMAPRGSCRVFLRIELQLLVSANVVHSSVVRFTLMLEATRSSETYDLTRSTRHHMPEDGIRQFLSNCTNRGF
jgi:hypothetical protein